MDGLAPRPPWRGFETPRWLRCEERQRRASKPGERAGTGQSRPRATGRDASRWLRCEERQRRASKPPRDPMLERGQSRLRSATGFEARPWTASHLSHRGGASRRLRWLRCEERQRRASKPGDPMLDGPRADPTDTGFETPPVAEVRGAPATSLEARRRCWDGPEPTPRTRASRLGRGRPRSPATRCDGPRADPRAASRLGRGRPRTSATVGGASRHRRWLRCEERQRRASKPGDPMLERGQSRLHGHRLRDGLRWLRCEERQRRASKPGDPMLERGQSRLHGHRLRDARWLRCEERQRRASKPGDPMLGRGQSRPQGHRLRGSAVDGLAPQPPWARRSVATGSSSGPRRCRPAAP